MDPKSPRPVNTRSDAHFFMEGCTITRSQLDRIWKLACDGFEDDAHIVVETERITGVVSSKISSDSIDDTIEGVRQATLPGDPNYIDNLRLYVSDRSMDANTSRTVSINISPKRVQVSVSGADPGWVRGRIEGLKDLFAETRTKWVIGGGDLKYIATIIGLGAGVFTALGISLSLNAHTSPGIIILLFVVMMAVFMSGGLIFGRWMDRRAQVRLLLFDDAILKHGLDKINITMLIVTIIGVIVAILAILVAHHDSTKGQSTGLFPFCASGAVSPLRACHRPTPPD